MTDQEQWTGQWDDDASAAEQAFMDAGYIVNTGPGALSGSDPNGIIVKLVEGNDGRTWAYPDMDRDFNVDRDELGALKPPVAVYDPATGRINEDPAAVRIAQR